MTLSVDGTGPPRFQLDNGLRRWFERNLGLWRSRRLYFFADEAPLQLDMLLRVERFAEANEGEARYRMSWWTEQGYDFFTHKPDMPRAGSMEASLCGHQLQRTSSFLANTPVCTRIRQVDEHQLSFATHQGELSVLEHIRLVDQDRFRARSIYTWRQGDLEVSEMHHEIRLEAAGVPLL
ncbi:hypothetical protein [Cyanobium sp. Morenito 9A2]|uniref:hypothetical protein n=1 Tax=Cyanobium sp. Morenito 9A2 TaxID=2823718 RepID=UPI0020CF90B2|nr:hypothetical protein [Cyanobium sp. Morenito 9A2]MCP9848378.1 hypothetical protein [Cyanobium sp. Morenito 9A2]